MTRARDIADQQKNLGGAVAPFVAGKNAIINGGFDIWQRGTSFNNAAAYTADRWYSANGGSATITRQTTGVPNNAQYCWRFTATGSNVYAGLYQFIETANVIPLQGKTVTAQIKLRRNATMNVGLVFFVDKSSTVDAGAGATWTTINFATITNVQLPTGTTSSDWYTASVTCVIPNDGTANSIRLNVQESAVLPNGSIWEAAQVQLEIGSVATPFSRAGGSIGGELALCQRYYQRSTPISNIYTPFGLGTAGATTAIYIPITLKQTMRTQPSAIDFLNLVVSDVANNALPISNLTLMSNWFNDNVVNVTATLTGATQFRSYFLIANGSTSSYLGFSAEL